MAEKYSFSFAIKKIKSNIWYNQTPFLARLKYSYRFFIERFLLISFQPASFTQGPTFDKP